MKTDKLFLLKSSICILLLCLTFLSGCTMVTSGRGLKPVFPEAGNPNVPETIDSLTPTFKWESNSDTSSTYDLIIYECHEQGNWFVGRTKLRGPLAYYREGLIQTEHKIERTLKPDTVYFWNLRSRVGDRVSEWASYKWVTFAVIAAADGSSNYFLFKTPNISKK